MTEWAIGQFNPAKTASVLARLLELGIGAYHPAIVVRKRRPRQRRAELVTVSAYPGYLFIPVSEIPALSPDAPVRLMRYGRPAVYHVISDATLSLVREAEASWAIPKGPRPAKGLPSVKVVVDTPVVYPPGAELYITEGLFKGLKCKVRDTTGRQVRIKVEGLTIKIDASLLSPDRAK